jgi:cytoskeletal protein CcmA (bactofilin family)
MLGNKKSGFGNSGSTTLVSRDTVVVGEIHFSGNLDVEGVVKGSIVALPDTEAWVRVVHGGRVEGDIRVPSIVINGSVEGNVHSAKHLELATKGVVHGDVFYTLLEMAAGSEVNGALRHITDPDAGGKSGSPVARPGAPAEAEIAVDKGYKVIVD